MTGGTALYSPVDGVVYKVGKSSSAGNFVTILGEDGRLYDYFHLQSIPNVKVGTNISADQMIGNSGNTGEVYGQHGGYHLHLQITENGKFLEPETTAGLLNRILGAE